MLDPEVSFRISLHFDFRLGWLARMIVARQDVQYPLILNYLWRVLIQVKVVEAIFVSWCLTTIKR